MLSLLRDLDLSTTMPVEDGVECVDIDLGGPGIEPTLIRFDGRG